MYGQNVLYDYAMRLVGTPYRWGGDDTMEGFDCSGMCLELLKAFGKVPHSYDLTSQGIHNFLQIERAQEIKEGKFGAMVFFGLSVQKITHIAMCINNEVMIEAGGGGSKTKTLKDAVNSNAFVRIRPIKNRSDQVSILMPNYSWITKANV